MRLERIGARTVLAMIVLVVLALAIVIAGVNG